MLKFTYDHCSIIAKCNFLATVTDNSTTAACHWSTFQDNSMMVSGNYSSYKVCWLSFNNNKQFYDQTYTYQSMTALKYDHSRCDLKENIWICCDCHTNTMSKSPISPACSCDVTGALTEQPILLNLGISLLSLFKISYVWWRSKINKLILKQNRQQAAW